MAHGHKNKGGSNKLNHLLSFLSPGKPLKGKDLYKAAKAEAKITTKPQVDAYKRLAKQLKAQEKFDTKGLTRLGNKTAGAVGSVYHGVAQEAAQNLAQQSAIGNQLVGQTAAAGQAASKGLAQGQSAQLSGFLAGQKQMNAPQTGTAQQQLAQVVANQQQNQQAEARAQQAFASSQAASNIGLAGNLGQSAQLQGATAVSGIRSAITSRIGAQKLQAQQDISEARGKAADARALKGSAIVQALQQLRGQEQQYLLGKAATAATVQGNKLQAKSSAASTAASIANSKRSNQQDAHQFNKTHTKGGRPLGSKPVKGSGSSSSNNSHATQHTHQKQIQTMLAQLRTGNQAKLHKMSRKQLIDTLVAGKTSTQSRAEAKAAVRKYLGGGGGHKKGHKKPPPHAI